MPPKRATRAATGPRRSARAKHTPELFANTESSVTAKPSAAKRKADAEPAQPAPKRAKAPSAQEASGKKPSAATAPQKRRGRPTKAQRTAQSTSAAPTLKSRGRPKKVAPVVEAAPPAVASRGRGRTKKATSAVEAPTPAASSRGRGRPRKSDAAEAVAPTTRTKKTPVSRKTTTTSKKAPAANASTARAKTPAPVKASAKAPAKPTAKTSTASKNTTSRGRPSKRAAEEELGAPAAKKAKVSEIIPSQYTEAEAAATLPKATFPLEAPTEKLAVFLMGVGESGELGMGPGKAGQNAKRPRLNKLLESAGVVQVAPGGMHCAALTHDGKVLTWGVNDQGALGRNTDWAGGLRDVDAEESSDSGSEAGGGLNPHEATPTAIDTKKIATNTEFVQVAAGDSATFALTSDGKVYGWGTFRDAQGVLGFLGDGDEQRSPILIKGLSKIISIACGNNFALALTADHDVYSWGVGQQNQLGRTVTEDARFEALKPQTFGLPKGKITSIFAGSDHSFAQDMHGFVWSWGLNNYGQCGIVAGAGEGAATVPEPTIVTEIEGLKIKMLAGGTHHSLAVTEKGECIAWGRADGSQLGISMEYLEKLNTAEVGRNESSGKVALLKSPDAVLSPPDATIIYATTSADHSITLDDKGRAYSWGFSTLYQTGQGTDDDIEVATLIDNTAIRGKRITWAGCGGQFSVLACPVSELSIANGITSAAASMLGNVAQTTTDAVATVTDTLPPMAATTDGTGMGFLAAPSTTMANGGIPRDAEQHARGADAVHDVADVARRAKSPALANAAAAALNGDVEMGNSQTVTELPAMTLGTTTVLMEGQTAAGLGQDAMDGVEFGSVRPSVL